MKKNNTSGQLEKLKTEMESTIEKAMDLLVEMDELEKEKP